MSVKCDSEGCVHMDSRGKEVNDIDEVSSSEEESVKIKVFGENTIQTGFP